MTWLVLTFVAGIALIIAEFFIPGMICGIAGGLTLVGGAIYGVVTFPQHAFFIIFIYLMGSVIAVVAGVFWFPRSSLGKRMILADGLETDENWVSDVSDETLLGKTGTCFTPLRPSGTINIEGRRVDAVTSGDYIGKGATVTVLEVHGNRVVVEVTETESE